DALQAARAASLGKRELVRARLIIDCDGFSLENIRHIPVLKNIIALGKSYFPEVAASVTVVRAPSFIATFYSLLTPFLPKLLQDKISILGKDYQDGLRTHTSLGADSLPEFLGGKVKSQNNVLFLAGKKGKPLACNSRERTFESYVKILEEHTNVSLESAAEELFGSRKQSKRPRSLLRFMEKVHHPFYLVFVLGCSPGVRALGFCPMAMCPLLWHN
ncbi:unnamed protein product, partial [Effrenium voratum]